MALLSDPGAVADRCERECASAGECGDRDGCALGGMPPLPWWDLTEWQSDPQLSYVKGLQDGYAMALDQAHAIIADAVARAFGSDTSNLDEAITRHVLAIERGAETRLAATAAATREGTQWQENSSDPGSSSSTSEASASTSTGTRARPAPSRRPSRSVQSALARASSRPTG